MAESDTTTSQAPAVEPISTPNTEDAEIEYTFVVWDHCQYPNSVLKDEFKLRGSQPISEFRKQVMEKFGYQDGWFTLTNVPHDGSFLLISSCQAFLMELSGNSATPVSEVFSKVSIRKLLVTCAKSQSLPKVSNICSFWFICKPGNIHIFNFYF